MGCCASSPTGSDETQHDRAVPPQVRQSPREITSQTAINPVAQDRPSRGLEPPSANSLHQSETSRSGLSTSRHSSPSRGRSNHIGLAEHYNLPLEPPKPWASKDKSWTRHDLKRERYEFFETRVTGRPEIWHALRQVADCIRESDITTAQGILDAVGVTLPTGRIDEGGYDEAGNLYRIPEAILSDPTNLAEAADGDEQTVVGTAEATEKLSGTGDEDGEENDITEKMKGDKGKAAIEADALKIKCRLSDRGGPDVIVLLGKSQTVGVLVKRVRDQADIPSVASIRIAYLGRVLDEKESLSDQGWKEGHVVNVLVLGVFNERLCDQ